MAINRRRRRRALKALTGALIGGAIAGPIGVAAGAVVGASRRRGPVRRKMATKAKAGSPPIKSLKPAAARGPRKASARPPGKGEP